MKKPAAVPPSSFVRDSIVRILRRSALGLSARGPVGLTERIGDQTPNAAVSSYVDEPDR